MTNEIILTNGTIITAEGEHARKAHKPVICLETGEIFASVTDAAKAYQTDAGSISRCCRGKIRAVKGKHFFFATNAMENLNIMADHIRGTEIKHREAERKANAYDTLQEQKQAIKERIDLRRENIAHYEAIIARFQAARNKEAILLEEAKLDLKELLADDLEYLM